MNKLMRNKKYYNQQSPERRKVLKQLLEQQRSNFTKQKELIENSLIKALRERIQLIDKALKNEVDLKYYVKRQRKLGEYVTSFLIGGIKK